MSAPTEGTRTGRIVADDIKALRERVDIEDVVSQYVTLKSAGSGSLKGLCPFHDEKSPSFHVRPQMGHYHCFGCAEGGDVINFIQKVETLGFADAVEHLAARIGMTLRYEEGTGGVRRGEDPRRRGRLVAAHDAAQKFYAQHLMGPEARIAREFLAARGFGRDAAEHFGIGYAPQGWDHLKNHLRALAYTDAELEATGLLSEGARGTYDRFRGRLMWPIRDMSGDVIGFGARKLYDDDPGPKYLNTPETAIYKKSQVLYGLDLAKRDVARSKQVVVVEGYTDVMAMHLSGVTTAVATCGTAFGTDHIRLVRRIMGDTNANAALTSTGGQVVFTFDGDAAGQKAALRAFGEDQMFSAQTYVAVAPGGQDPCELRAAVGEEAVRDLINAKRPLFEFVIQSVLNAHDMTTAEGRVAALRAAAPVVASIRDAALRPEYVRLLAGWTSLDPVTVADAVRNAPPPRPEAIAAKASARPATRPATDQAPSGDGPIAPPDRRAPFYKFEKSALEAALQRPGAASAAGFDTLPADAFTDPAYAAVHAAITVAGGTSAALAGREDLPSAEKFKAVAAWLERVQEAGGERLANIISELVVAPLPQDEDELTKYACSVVETFQRVLLGRQIDQAKADLGQMDPNDTGYTAAFMALIDMENRRRELLSRIDA